MIYNDHICLSSQGSFKSPTYGNNKMNLTAIKVEYIKNPDSMFQIPADFEIQSFKLSEFLKDSITSTVEEIIQEEEKKPEPPPPPIKKPKTSKSPAQKPSKQKSGNN